jgi:hypothetical protein
MSEWRNDFAIIFQFMMSREYPLQLIVIFKLLEPKYT